MAEALIRFVQEAAKILFYNFSGFMVRWKGSERIGEDECTLITVINHSLFS